MATTIEQFSYRVSPLVPGLAVPVVEAAVLEVLGDFCRRTSIWRQTLDADYPIGGTNALGFSVPKYSRCTAIVKFKLDGRELELAGDEITEQAPAQGKPRRVALAAEQLWFDGQFKGGETVDFRGALAPIEGATTLPDIVAWDWSDAILLGALSRLKRYAGGDYNLGLEARRHEVDYEAAVLRAKARARSGETHARRTTSYGGL